MDLRITYTCNNNCLYCLEQPLRKKEPFLSVESILVEIKKKNPGDRVFSIYGGNPLLHPYIEEIISLAKEYGFESIGILSNTHGLDANKLMNLVDLGLNNFGFYFHSFIPKVHNKIVNGGISLSTLLSNIQLLKQSPIQVKPIIHINSLNIKHISQTVYYLSQLGMSNIEFINYFPFDRPYDDFHKDLGYDSIIYRMQIDRLFQEIIKLLLSVKFIKFSREFFGDFSQFYNKDVGILEQISKEDRERISGNNPPFCFIEKRCNFCFIKNHCKFYEGKDGFYGPNDSKSLKSL